VYGRVVSSDVVRGDLRWPIFKGLTVRRLYKSFGVKGLNVCVRVFSDGL
jgi:hypothetical protein